MRWTADTWVGREDHDQGRFYSHINFSDTLGAYKWRVCLDFQGGGTAQIAGQADDVRTAKRRVARAVKRLLKNPNKYR
jgi:hypothetical protein